MSEVCLICNREFANKNSLSSHKYTFHSQTGGSKGEQVIIKNRIDEEQNSEVNDSWDLTSADGNSSPASDNSIEKWRKESCSYMLEEKHKAAMKSMQEKVNFYAETLQALQNEDQIGLDPLEKAIFNNQTIWGIIKIEKLISKYRFDEVVSEHVDTLQKLLMALSYGVIPVTLPQRQKLSNRQRKLIKEISVADVNEAGLIIKGNIQEIAHLFTVIDDSLKLVRNSFHRFPIQKQRTIISDAEDSDMED